MNKSFTLLITLVITIFATSGINSQRLENNNLLTNQTSDQQCQDLSITNVVGIAETDCDRNNGQIEIYFNDLSTDHGLYTISFVGKSGQLVRTQQTGNPILITGISPGAYGNITLTRESDQCATSEAATWVSIDNGCDVSTSTRACGTGTTSIASCDGLIVTANQQDLEFDSYFTLIANPTPWINCIAYVDNNCEFDSLEGWAFCVNFNLDPPGQFQQYSRTTNFMDVGLSELELARLEWIFCNAGDFGFNVATASGRGNIQSAIWAITDNRPATTLSTAAVNAIPDAGSIPPNTGSTFTGFQAPGGSGLQNLILFNEECAIDPNCGSIISVKVYDADTDVEAPGIGPLTNGSTLFLADLPTNYYLTVETTSDISSVLINVDGTLQNIENIIPYTFPNGGANWNGGAGSHTLVAWAFDAQDGGGNICDSVQLGFDIVDCGSSQITGLYIYDQSNDQAVIGPIGNGSLVDSEDLPANYYLVVETTSGLESMDISVNGQGQPTDNTVAYTYPSNAQNGNNWNAGQGTYNVVATAYTADDAGGSICSAFDLTFTIEDEVGWDYDCGDGLSVDIYPIGANGNTVTTIDIPNPENVTRVIAELVYKGGNPGPTVEIEDAAGNLYTMLGKTVPSGFQAFGYRAVLPATSSVIYTNSSNTNDLQSMTLYVERAVDAAAASIGIFTNLGGFNDTYTIPLSGIPVSNVPRDINLQIPISEITLDNRYITVSATAGGVTDAITRCFNPGDLPLGCCISLFNLSLPNVPGNVSTIDVQIETTNGQGPGTCANNGQSFVISSYIQVEVECQPGDIAGNVSDNNGNPIPNVKILLYNDVDADGQADGAAIDSVFTDNNGNYGFNDLDADDYVLIQEQPANYVSISDFDSTPDPDGDDSALGPNNQIAVTVSPEELDADNDFVELQNLGSISGNVSDDNGIPLEGVQLTLDDNDPNTTDPSVFTDEFGNYTFEDVEPGDYVIVQAQPAGYTSVSDQDDSPEDANDADGVANNQIPVTVQPGESDVDNNFVEDPIPGSIGGSVTDDQGNPIAGVTITLDDGDPNTVDPTAVTNAQGVYKFSNVEPGDYTLVQTQPDGYDSVSDEDGSPEDANDADGLVDNQIPVTVELGETDVDNDFVEDPQAGTVSGNVSDDNGNPLAGVELTLDDNDPNTTDPTVTTDEFGNYTFNNVEPGDYVIVQTQPDNYTSLSDEDDTPEDANDADGVVNNQIPVTVTPGEDDTDNNFVEDPDTGSVTGNVSDNEGNPLAGVELTLDDNDPNTTDPTVTTDEFGNYTFDNVEPGDYMIVQTQPDNYTSVSDEDGTPEDANDADGLVDNQIPVTVQPGEVDADNDFVEDPNPGTISGNVSDNNGNPLAGVELTLDDNDPNTTDPTVTTDEFGNYTFDNVEPGDYVIVQTQPDNYTSVSDEDDSPEDANDADGVVNNQIPVTVTPGEDDTDNNFVEDPNAGSVTGNVSDNEGNPLAGVELTLDDNDPNTTDPTVTTDEFGNYTFDNVEPGDYVIVQTQPDNYTSVSDEDGTPEDANDADGLVDNQIPVTVQPGELDADNDFVEDPNPGTISGNVSDNNGNPLAGVELTLDDNDPNTTDPTVTTDEFGNYTFDNVEPGDYVIVQTQPDNYTSVSDEDDSPEDANDADGVVNNQIPVTVTPGEDDTDNNFVEDPNTGSVTGNVSDNEGNPLAGVELTLDDNDPNTTDPTVTTDEFGNYTFDNVEPGDYVIVQTQPDNYASVSDEDGSPEDANDADGLVDNQIPVTVQPGEVDADNDFVEDPNPGTISGNVSDNNGNPLAGVELTLDDNDPNTTDPTVTTDEFGNYTFDNVEPGDYVIVQTQPDNYTSVSDEDDSPEDANDADGVVNNQIPVTVTPGEDDTDNNFVEDPNAGSVTGNVSDNEGNPLAGVELTLDDNDPNTTDPTVTTDEFGNYTFDNVEPGDYVIVQTQPDNYTSVSDEDGTPEDANDADGLVDNQIPVTVQPGEVDADNDFVEDPNPGSISGNVSDQFGNPIEGVTITLNDNDPNTTDPTVITDEFGNYSFNDVEPGDYTLLQEQPENYNSVSDEDDTPEDANDADGLVDNQIPVTVTPGEADDDNNFVEDPFPGSVSGFVYEDFDNNDTPVPGEGLFGVLITLYEDENKNGNVDVEDGVVGTTTTNFDGFYIFENVTPDDYIVAETQPIAYNNVKDDDQSAPDPGNDLTNTNLFNDAIPVSVAPDEADADNNFLEASKPGSISGTVYEDFDLSNAPSVGEGIENVRIILHTDEDGDGILDSEDVALDSVLTDGNGDYIFEDTEPDDYLLREIQPSSPILYDNVSDNDASAPDLGGDAPNFSFSDDIIPVTVAANEADQDNDFVEILCAEPPMAFGDFTSYICDGETVTFEAVPQDIEGLTYTWDFGVGATPQTAVGLGPHTVTFDYVPEAAASGASITILIEKVGCPPKFAQVAQVIVSPIPDASIDASTDVQCVMATKTFQPVADFQPGASYFWDFGEGASPASATGYGPHDVVYQTAGDKTATLIVDPNFVELANCPDTSSIDFLAVICLGNISGKVTIDDANNSPLPGVQMSLFADSNGDGEPDGNQLTFTFTNPVGGYVFVNLMPGDYVVVQNQPNGYDSVLDEDFSPDGDNAVNTDPLDNQIPVTVEPLETDADNDFIETVLDGAISGTVYEDLDGSGDVTAGEGISGVIIRLFADSDTDGAPDSAIPLETDTTDLSGNYLFPDVAPESYVVIEEQPVDYNSVQDADASPDPDVLQNANDLDDIIPVTIIPGEVDADNDFVEAGKDGSVSGKVTVDDGTPLENVAIQLFNDFNGNGVVDPADTEYDNTSTNAQGEYQFEVVPSGNYVVRETQPANYNSVSDGDGTPDAGNDVVNANTTDDDIPVTVAANEDDADNDFVETPILSSIGDLVWLDLNGDGIQQLAAGETGIQGVTILLFKNGESAGFDITGSNGEYLFDNLAAGNYTVTVIPPADREPTYDEDNGTVNPDNSSNVTLGINDDHLTADFGYKPTSASLGNRVWFDANRNGIQFDDAEEFGFQDVTVSLYEANGDVFVGQRVTDDMGEYTFAELAPNKAYYIIVDVPAGYSIVPQNVSGSNEANDSDIDFVTGKSDNVFLLPGENNMDVDAGIQQPEPGIADPCGCLNNATTPDNGQFSELVSVLSAPGETWTIVEQTGMVDNSSPDPPGDPIPVPIGTQLTPEADPLGKGVFYTISFKHINAIGYTIVVSNGPNQFTLSISNLCTYPTIDTETIPADTVCVLDPPFAAENVMADWPGMATILVNGVETSAFNPGDFEPGTTVSFEVIFDGQDGATDGSSCASSILKGVLVIADCAGDLTGHIYWDSNGDGMQDLDGLTTEANDDEPNLANIDVMIRNAQGDSITTVETNAEGDWIAKTLEPGEYSADVDESDPDFPLNSIQTEGTDPTVGNMVLAGMTADAGNDGYTRCTDIEPYVFLEGSMIFSNGQIQYDKEEMRNDLNTTHVLPGQSFFGPIEGLKYTLPGQPYNQPPWNYGGTEGDLYDSGGDPDFGDANYPPEVVDWVLVYLRESPDGSDLCKAAALLNQDGSITFVDDFGCCELNPFISYYVVIEHRNHLIVMSATGKDLSAEGKVTHDFRHTDSYIVSGSFGQKFLGTNLAGLDVYCMVAGNGDQLSSEDDVTDINLNDLVFWTNDDNTISVYFISDYNMDADVNLNDQNTFLINNNRFSAVPR